MSLCALAAGVALGAPACGGGDDEGADGNPAQAGSGGSSGTGGVGGAPPSKGPSTEDCPPESELTYENFGAPFLLSWCNGCHSSSLPEGSRQSAPLGIDFDGIDKVRAQSARILARTTGESPTMPPSGGPPEAERSKLAEWLACGAPSGGQFTGLPTGPADTAGAGGAGGGAPSPLCGALGKPLPAEQLPRCKAETKVCFDACATNPDKDACEKACLAAEPAPTNGGPSCEDCLFRQAVAYAETNGCGPLASEGFCCIFTQCPTFDPTCLKQKCAVETESMFYCIAYVTPEAFTSNPLRDACFAAP
ncbi:MAG TPA: hypothetical protein VFS43_07945 [Polyangiaceae bacterium]|nr:hypothetical protein [Polyangiaceae bacterium]